jgi:hypothetical protein
MHNVRSIVRYLIDPLDIWFWLYGTTNLLSSMDPPLLKCLPLSCLLYIGIPSSSIVVLILYLFGKCLVLLLSNMHGDTIFALCMCPVNHGVLINSMILFVLMFALMLLAHTDSCTPWYTALKVCQLIIIYMNMEI